MNVYRKNPDGSLVLLGTCHDMDPPPRVSVPVRVLQPMRMSMPDSDARPDDAIPVAHFPVIPVADRYGPLPPAIEHRDGGPPLEWLPGWRPA